MVKLFRVLLMNCTERDEPSEVSFLSEFFKMMNLRYPKSIRFSPIDVNDKKQFLDLLKDRWTNILLKNVVFKNEEKPLMRGKHAL